MARVELQAAAQDRALLAAFAGIADMADKLGLPATVKDAANETYKLVGTHAPRCAAPPPLD